MTLPTDMGAFRSASGEEEVVAGKRGATRLGFVLLLKFYSRHGRFPRGPAEFDDDVVDFVARQVGVPAAEFGVYEWSGRTIEFHRSQIRAHLGYRECSVADADRLTGWLSEGIAQVDRRPEVVRDEFVAQCRIERIEPVVRWVAQHELDEVAADLALLPSQEAAAHFQGVHLDDRKTLSNIFSTARLLISAWMDPTVAASSEHCDITPDKFFNGEINSLYLATTSRPDRSAHTKLVRWRPGSSALLREGFVATTQRPRRATSTRSQPRSPRWFNTMIVLWCASSVRS